MTEIFLSEAEREAIAVLADAAVEPGTRCPCCNRRVNKARQDTSPDTKEIRIKMPIDQAESAEEAFDILQEVVGADPYSYPRGQILQALLVLGGQHREQLKSYFQWDGS